MFEPYIVDYITSAPGRTEFGVAQKAQEFGRVRIIFCT